MASNEEPKSELPGKEKGLGSMSLSDTNKYQEWPESWRDNRKGDNDSKGGPGNHIEKDSHRTWVADIEEREPHLSSQGLPPRRVTVKEEEGTRGLPTTFTCPDLGPAIERVALFRCKPSDNLCTEPGLFVSQEQVDSGKYVEVENLSVRKDQVDTYLANGWKIWFPAFNPRLDNEDLRDPRGCEIAQEIVSLDHPVRDSNRYLQVGNDFVHRVMTDQKWKIGDLIGKDGSNEDVKKQSWSYIAAEDRDKSTETRSATSIGHFKIHPRPNGVPLGWGDYDKTYRLQQFGRHITKDMVEKKEWSTDPLPTLEFEDDDGNVEVIKPAFGPEKLPPLPTPVSLYDRLHKNDKKRGPESKPRPGPAFADKRHRRPF